MLAGHNVEDPENDFWEMNDVDGGLCAMRWFSQHLFRQGYLSAPAFTAIIDPAQRDNLNKFGEFRPEGYNIL